MKFKNISNKVIGIDGKYVMPGQTVEISEEDARLPAVHLYTEMGFAVVEDSPVNADNPASGGGSAIVDSPAVNHAPAPTAEDAREVVADDEMPDFDAKSKKKGKARTT